MASKDRFYAGPIGKFPFILPDLFFIFLMWSLPNTDPLFRNFFTGFLILVAAVKIYRSGWGKCWIHEDGFRFKPYFGPSKFLSMGDVCFCHTAESQPFQKTWFYFVFPSEAILIEHLLYKDSQERMERLISLFQMANGQQTPLGPSLQEKGN